MLCFFRPILLKATTYFESHRVLERLNTNLVSEKQISLDCLQSQYHLQEKAYSTESICVVSVAATI